MWRHTVPMAKLTFRTIKSKHANGETPYFDGNLCPYANAWQNVLCSAVCSRWFRGWHTYIHMHTIYTIAYIVQLHWNGVYVIRTVRYYQNKSNSTAGGGKSTGTVFLITYTSDKKGQRTRWHAAKCSVTQFENFHNRIASDLDHPNGSRELDGRHLIISLKGSAQVWRI